MLEPQNKDKLQPLELYARENNILHDHPHSIDRHTDLELLIAIETLQVQRHNLVVVQNCGKLELIDHLGDTHGSLISGQTTTHSLQ